MMELPKCTQCGDGLPVDSRGCACGSGESIQMIQDGDKLKTEKIELNLGHLKLRLINKSGKELTPGEDADCFSFEVSGPGIHPQLVKRVKFVLDYSRAAMAMATVEQYVFEHVIPEKVT